MHWHVRSERELRPIVVQFLRTEKTFIEDKLKQSIVKKFCLQHGNPKLFLYLSLGEIEENEGKWNKTGKWMHCQ